MISILVDSGHMREDGGNSMLVIYIYRVSRITHAKYINIYIYKYNIFITNKLIQSIQIL